MADEINYRELYDQTSAEFRTFIDRVPLSVFRATARRQLIHTNRRFTRLFGLEAGQDIPEELFDHFGIAMRRRIEAQLLGTAIDEVEDYIEVPVNIDDRERHVRVHLMVTNGLEGPEILGYCQDATQEYEHREMLRAEARTDPLSGLANRKGLEDFFAAFEGERLAVILCDADGFKGINDTLGHDAGDHVIVTFAERLRRAMRPTDLVARVGGDEFVIVAPCVPSAAIAEQIAERCHVLFRQPMEWEGRTIQLSATMGLVHGKPDEPPEDLLRKADEALYEAKEAGRDRIGVYTAELSQKSMTPLVVQAELGKALAADELRIDAQPVFNVNDGHVDLEALLRWDHPAIGPIGPAEAIPAAEKTGLIRPLGRWVVQAAAELVAGHDSATSVTVNMSVTQVADPLLAEHLRSVTASLGLSPDRVGIELTEAHLVATTDGAATSLAEIAADGVRIVADGFGAGSTTVADLLSLPVSGVKLDDALLDAGATAVGRRTLRSIVRGLTESGLYVVAKGIENELRLEVALDAGIVRLQGMHLAEPVRIEMLPDVIAEGRSRMLRPAA